LDRARGDTISGKNGVATVGFVLLLAALVVALDGNLALRAIDRLAQSEGYTDIQNVMTARTPLTGSEVSIPKIPIP
jgi:hypothetical protein